MNRFLRCATLLGLTLGLAASHLPAEAQAPALATEDSKTIYAIGLAIAQNLGQFSFSEDEVKVLSAGLVDGVLKHPAQVKLEEYGPKIQAFAQARIAVAAEKEKTASTDFLAKEAAKPGAVKSDSGLIYTEVAPGTGASPKATDSVTVNYKGTLRDGTVFDSSYDRGEPASFRLDGVIKCWTEGVQKMKVGGKARLVCPAAIAYGDRGAGGTIPPGAALVFEVELISIAENKTEAPAPPPAPKN
ncbi:MAG: FKBP-type peptidyl-prolyl cis-trans isomerase [Thermoanaerobaculia bacterium]